MLMIWSSRARNRSFDPVVLCFFGRIVPSDATQNHARRFEGILKMKLQASGAPDPKSLQSKNPFPRKTESPIKVLQVLHGRLPLPLRERVGVRGSGLSIEHNPSRLALGFRFRGSRICAWIGVNQPPLS